MEANQKDLKGSFNIQAKFKILILVFLSCSLVIPFQAGISANITHNPVVETFDLLQDGSTTTYKTNITKDFDVVTKMNWVLNFDDILLDWNNFAAASALSNGVYVDYGNNGNMIDPNYNITNNWQLINLAYNAHHFMDDKNPVGHIIWIQHLLTSFIDGGITIDDTHTISVWVQDNLTDSNLDITSFTVTLKGYQRVIQTYFVVNELFYPNAINDVLLQDMTVGTNYNLYINTSNSIDGAKWINTTAKSETIQIKLAFDTEEADVMHLYLYEGDTLLESRDWFIQVTDLEPAGNTINNIVLLIAAVLVGFAFLGFLGNRNRKY